jgi:hypothetical protein
VTAIVPYGIQAYKRADLPKVTLRNLFAEAVPANLGGTVLLPRPALTEPVTRGSGPINSMFQQNGVFGGDTFTLSGTDLYREGANLGAIDISTPAQMVAATTSLLIATGGNFWRSDGATVALQAFPDDAAVQSVAYLGGYAFAIRANSRRIYYTLDPTTWDGLDYVSAEQSSDYGVGLMVVIDQLWVFCDRHIEIFFLTGDADAPIQRVQGRVFDKGAVSRESIQKFDNTVAWLANDGVVYRGDNTPVRISDHGIEEAVKLGTEAPRAMVFPWVGHLFYVLNLGNATYAFDAATAQWHELASYGHDAFRAWTTAGDLFGDLYDGTLWTLADDVFLDDGQPMQREFSMIVQERAFIDRIDLDMGTGAPSAGIIEMRKSRDGGNTWGVWQQVSTGAPGEYRKGISFRSQGLSDRAGLVFHFRISDDVPSRISQIKVNDTGGNHGSA